MDRGGHVERPLLPQHEPGHDRHLAGEHRGEDDEAPQRGTPELPDAGWALDGEWRRREGTCGIEGIHQLTFMQGNARSSNRLMSSRARSTAPYMLA